MNVEFFCFLIIIVKSWAGRSKYVIRLEADHVLKETSKLINLTLHLNIWARILLEKAIMLKYFALQVR